MRISVGGPFERRSEVNFVSEGGKVIIIPLGKLLREIEIYPYVTFMDRTYSASFITVREVEHLFRKKYGDDHFTKYFVDAKVAVVLEELASPPSVNYDMIGEAFDQVSKEYTSNVKANWVQEFMRQASLSLLRKYVNPGDRILDLGSGPDSEVFGIGQDVSITEVDVSRSMIQLSKEIHKEQKAEYLLMRGTGDITKTYDILFSTYGYLNIESERTIQEIIDRNLREGGLFIGSYLNRYGLMDSVLNTLQLRPGYVRERFSGEMSVNSSRYGMKCYPRSPAFFKDFLGLKTLHQEGVCISIPPYNFTRLNGIVRKTQVILWLENILRKIPYTWALADYVMFVSRKVSS